MLLIEEVLPWKGNWKLLLHGSSSTKFGKSFNLVFKWHLPIWSANNNLNSLQWAKCNLQIRESSKVLDVLREFKFIHVQLGFIERYENSCRIRKENREKSSIGLLQFHISRIYSNFLSADGNWVATHEHRNRRSELSAAHIFYGVPSSGFFSYIWKFWLKFVLLIFPWLAWPSLPEWWFICADSHGIRRLRNATSCNHAQLSECLSDSKKIITFFF